MKKIAWDFYKQRTGKSLENILGDIRSIEAARKKLDKMNLKCPSDDVIQEALNRLIKRDKQKAEAEKEILWLHVLSLIGQDNEALGL